MFTLVPSTRRLAALCITAVALSACGGGGKGSTAPGGPAPGPSTSPIGIVPGTQPTVQASPPGTTAVNPAAYVCPSSDATASVTRGSVSTGEAVRRVARRQATSAAVSAAAMQLVAVTYDARAATQRTTLATRESSLGVTRVRDYTFAHANLVTHVLAVPAAKVTGVEAQLRQMAGVRSVGLTGSRRYPTSVNQPYFPNDPYFTGFSTTNPVATGAAAPPSTFEVEPLAENADVPGQWDMHVTRLEYAFAYSQPNNGSGITSAAALGSSAVKIAIIDTGEDANHPELNTKIVYQHCFITSPSNVQSTSAFSTDPDGHGTDVAGIAGAATNNSLGFSAAGGNSQIYAYRVFPTPDDSCAKTTSTSDQCGGSTQDIASAILDAVNNHVNVISLSLGGSGCTSSGADPDTAEGNAIADAIAANIVVVAAAGNSGGPPVEAPGCDPGVIAVGATSLADGQMNGSGKTGGSASAPFEYVASYSDYGTPAAAPGNSSAWGIVAPGGDPISDGSDNDDLHWIENLWTSTPFKATPGDTSFAGNCVGDYPGQTGTVDCRTLIAGTSMSTPHVAGAAALIIAANPAYQSPALMKQLLCTTADDISDPNEGCGRLDVYRAMATAVNDPSPPSPNPIP